MSLQDSMSIQNQIRENSDELQNFLRDMDNWEKDMKKKEQELKLISETDEQEVPPIRNSLSRSKKRNRHKKNKEKVKSNATRKEDESSKERISSYNYKGWEKFDVESELKKLDEEKKESSSSDSGDNEEKLTLGQCAVIKEDLETELKKLDEEKKESSSSDSTDNEDNVTLGNRKQLAIIKKDNGNAFFKDGNYDSAINCYTIGMELDPDNALLPANRAMAFLKKEQFQAAENDCTLCLSLDSTYVKAYLRRGAARSSLKKFLLAKDDFLKVLEIEPENKQAQLELEKIHKEICTEQDEITTSVTETQEAVSEIFSSDNSDDETGTCYLLDGEPVPLEVEIKEFCEDSFIKLEPSNYDHDEFLGSFKQDSDDSSTEQRELQSIDSGIIPTIAELPIKPSGNETEMDSRDILNEIEGVVSTLEKSLPPVPTASYQFLTDWKMISKYPELKYNYLKQFPPENLSVLFKNYMEPELFPEILNTLSTFFMENGDDVFYYMKHLSSVGRFNTMLMFMSDNEKSDLKKLSNYLQISGYPTSEVNTVLQIYKVL